MRRICAAKAAWICLFAFLSSPPIRTTKGENGFFYGYRHNMDPAAHGGAAGAVGGLFCDGGGVFRPEPRRAQDHGGGRKPARGPGAAPGGPAGADPGRGAGGQRVHQRGRGLARRDARRPAPRGHWRAGVGAGGRHRGDPAVRGNAQDPRGGGPGPVRRIARALCPRADDPLCARRLPALAPARRARPEEPGGRPPQGRAG